MRLYLSVSRHKLPSVSLVWKVSSESQNSTTIAQFLDQVDAIIPLRDEASSWTVKDYVVSLGGYECLHWQRIGDIMENGDEVRISPLRPSAKKRRVLSGRHQVSTDGSALVDGVPYGKDFNQEKKASRPAIHIPPRKRSRTTYESDENEAPVHVQTDKEIRVEQIFEDADASEDEDHDGGPSKRRRGEDSQGLYDNISGNRSNSSDSGDDAFETAESGSHLEDSDDSSLEGDDDVDSTKRLQFAPSVDSSVSSEDSDSSDVTSSSDSEVDSSSLSSSSESDSDDNSSSESSDAEAGSDSPESSSDFESENSSVRLSQGTPVQDQPRKVPKSKSLVVEKVSTTKATSQKSKNGVQSTTVSTTVPPGAGKSATARRNQRRKDTKQLEKLKSMNVLPPDADKEDLRVWRQGQQSTPSDLKSAMEAKRQLLLDAILDGGVDVTTESSSTRRPEKQEKTVNANGNGVEVTTGNVTATPETNATAETLAATGSSRRSRIDLESSRRLLFGSLGLRTPKTKVEEEALRNKLKTQRERKPIMKNGIEAAETNGTHDLAAEDEALSNTNESWKDKIHLTAVECCDENVHLSTPPFPFYQRWDPQQQLKSRKNKKRKRQSHNEVIDVTYLEYDDSFAPDAPLEQVSQSSAGRRFEDNFEDDLPALPPFPDSLNDLNFNDLCSNDIIAFKQLEVSEATGWQPAISDYRTARVTDVSPSTGYMQVRLARRDRPRHNVEYDDEGRRVYGKFEMPHPDDNDDNEDEALSEEDAGIIELDRTELIQPKLLRSALSQAHVQSSGEIIPDSLPAYSSEIVLGDTLDPQSQGSFVSPLPGSQLSGLLPAFDNVQAAQPLSTFISGLESSSESSRASSHSSNHSAESR